MMKNSTTLGMTTMSLREKISRATDVFVDVKVQNLPLQFYLSTLDGLADLFEDEIIPTPIPMKVRSTPCFFYYIKLPNIIYFEFRFSWKIWPYI